MSSPTLFPSDTVWFKTLWITSDAVAMILLREARISLTAAAVAAVSSIEIALAKAFPTKSVPTDW